MNSRDQQQQHRDRDLSAAYQAAATEKTPEHLDREILIRARTGLRTGMPGAQWQGLYRPVALVATLGICLALFLQTDLPVLSPGVPEPATNDRSTVSGRAFRDAADAAAAELGRIGTQPAMLPGREAAPDAPLDADAGEVAPRSQAPQDLLTQEQRCNDEQRSTASSWWQCIEELEKLGQSSNAEAELQALMRAFPRFVAPE